MEQIVPAEQIQQKIFMIRGQKVMLDRDLAELYGVSTKVLNQAVKRNLRRFPDDFMFTLTLHEAANLKSQIVTSSFEHGGARKPTAAFTEQGIAMLSGVLNSDRAIDVNIAIFRAFTRMRQMVVGYEELRLKVEAMERQYEGNFREVFDALHRLSAEPESPREEIGFRVDE